MFRLIARLDVKGPNVIKGIQFEGLRVVGKPQELARKYYDQGADELLFIDTVASLYGRNGLEQVIEETAAEAFIPITVGGGIMNLQDCDRLFRAGADKIAVNTAAVQRPALISEISGRYGSQALCVSIEAKRRDVGWEAYTDNGRQATGRDAIEWAREAVALGAGELLLTSVDLDGTRKGLDLAILDALGWLPVPVVISGGCSCPDNVAEAQRRGADAVAIASVLHSNMFHVEQLRNKGFATP